MNNIVDVDLLYVADIHDLASVCRGGFVFHFTVIELVVDDDS